VPTSKPFGTTQLPVLERHGQVTDKRDFSGRVYALSFCASAHGDVVIGRQQVRLCAVGYLCSQHAYQAAPRKALR